MSTKQPKGIGIIRLSGSLMPHLLTFGSYTVKDRVISFAFSFDEIASRLLLPETYTIRSIYPDTNYLNNWNIFVESEAIPLVSEGERLPDVMPYYGHEEKEPILLRIEVEDISKRPKVDAKDLLAAL